MPGEEPRHAPAAAFMPGKPAATIYDIARLAGVNPSTVSRALSKPGRINIKTEERIQLAAKELNYRLNPMARALPTGRTNTLGLLLADITNPMFFDVVRGAERAAAENGYTLILAESQESGTREKEAANRVITSVDGLILVATRMTDGEITEFAQQRPLIVVNREVGGIPSVLPDLAPGIDAALAHLAGIGHTSLAFLSGPESSWMSGARWNLLHEMAPKHGLTIAQIGPGSPTLGGGAEALARVLDSGASAVLAYNDLMAIGLMRAAQEGSSVVPGRLSIIGFDDIFGSDFTSPQLTTIRTPLALAGEHAVRLALHLIGAGADSVPRSGAGDPAFRTEFVLRGSTGPIST